MLVPSASFFVRFFVCPKKEPKKGHASLNAPQGKRRPAHNNHNY
jgi:hypothetical protein